jgi:hypothetical protein
MFLVRRLAADVANQIHAVRYGFSLSYHAVASVLRVLLVRGGR